jgi:hypothetical protein
MSRETRIDVLMGCCLIFVIVSTMVAYNAGHADGRREGERLAAERLQKVSPANAIQSGVSHHPGDGSHSIRALLTLRDQDLAAMQFCDTRAWTWSDGPRWPLELPDRQERENR